MKNKVLLIGGAGFLGSHLADAFLANGWKVGILDRVSLANQPNVEQFTGELRDIELLRTALSKYPRVVFLAHAANGVPTADGLSVNFLLNLEIFLAVLEEAMRCGVQDFILFSSGGAVYGEAEDLPLREDHAKNPCSPYGVAKLAMEKYLAMAAHQRGFRHLSIRPSNPYGPRQNFQGAQGIIAVAMARIGCGEPLRILGDGSVIKDYIFVEDLAAALVRLSSNDMASGPFNIGSGQPTRLLDLISQIETIVEKAAVIIHEPAQIGDVKVNVLDISKVTKTIGWQPTVSLQAGLLLTWQWMKEKLKAAPVKKP